MRSAAARRVLRAITFSLLFLTVTACDSGQQEYGCRVAGTTCACAYGCRSDLPYRNERDCMAAYNREQSRNICSRSPCARGTCLQVTQDPGFACRCEGTGYYGHRCEKACPSAPMRGLQYPYECIVI